MKVTFEVPEIRLSGPYLSESGVERAVTNALETRISRLREAHAQFDLIGQDEIRLLESLINCKFRVTL